MQRFIVTMVIALASMFALACVHAAISALAADGAMNPKDVARSIKSWKIDVEKPNPTTV